MASDFERGHEETSWEWARWRVRFGALAAADAQSCMRGVRAPRSPGLGSPRAARRASAGAAASARRSTEVAGGKRIRLAAARASRRTAPSTARCRGSRTGARRRASRLERRRRARGSPPATARASARAPRPARAGGRSPRRRRRRARPASGRRCVRPASFAAASGGPERSHEPPGERGRAAHAHLLAEDRAHRELEPSHAPGTRRPGRRFTSGASAALSREMRGRSRADRRRDRTAAARARRASGVRRAREPQREHRVCALRLGAHGERADRVAELERAPIAAARRRPRRRASRAPRGTRAARPSRAAADTAAGARAPPRVAAARVAPRAQLARRRAEGRAHRVIELAQAAEARRERDVRRSSGRSRRAGAARSARGCARATAAGRAPRWLSKSRRSWRPPTPSRDAKASTSSSSSAALRDQPQRARAPPPGSPPRPACRARSPGGSAGTAGSRPPAPRRRRRRSARSARCGGGDGTDRAAIDAGRRDGDEEAPVEAAVAAPQGAIAAGGIEFHAAWIPRRAAPDWKNPAVSRDPAGIARGTLPRTDERSRARLDAAFLRFPAVIRHAKCGRAAGGGGGWATAK